MAMRGLIRHLDIATTARVEKSEIHVRAGERLSKNKGAPPPVATWRETDCGPEKIPAIASGQY